MTSQLTTLIHINDQLFKDLHPKEFFTDFQAFPVTIDLPDQSAVLIEGHHIIQRQKEAGLQEHRVLHYGLLTPQEAFKLYCYYQQPQAHWGILAKATLLDLAHHFWDAPTTQLLLWPRLQIKNKIQASDLKKVLQLPSSIRDRIQKNNWPLTLVSRFFDFEPSSLESLLNQLEAIPLNMNKLTDILDLVLGISKRDLIPVASILSPLLKALEEKPPFEKADLLRHQLHSLRYPQYQKKKDQFLSLVNQLSLPPGVHVEASPYFEKPEIQLQARLKNSQELKKFKGTLDSLAWESLFKII